MNIQSAAIVKSLKKSITQIFALAFLVMLPFIGICQPAGPGDAGNPDEVVPFDPNMNLVFLGLGLAFAIFVVMKKMNKKAAL